MTRTTSDASSRTTHVRTTHSQIMTWPLMFTHVRTTQGTFANHDEDDMAPHVLKATQVAGLHTSEQPRGLSVLMDYILTSRERRPGGRPGERRRTGKALDVQGTKQHRRHSTRDALYHARSNLSMKHYIMQRAIYRCWSMMC